MRQINTIQTARRALAGTVLAGVCLLAGCAAETGAGWPKMTDFSRISQKVLTPKEQEQAIQTMSADQKAEQTKAIEKIEKNK
jgi:hypothetical protein